MEPVPTSRHPSKHATHPPLGSARRDRFLLEFDRWRRKFHTLRHALQQAGLPRRVYYRWHKGQVIPNEATLRRVCVNTGFDIDYVLTGIPAKVGHNHLTLGFYQQRHAEAKTQHERDCAYRRIVAESLNVLARDYPKMHAELITEPEPVAILTHHVDTLLKFEIRIVPEAPGLVGFEVNRTWGGAPTMVAFGPCNEASLLLVLQFMRENIRKHRKTMRDNDILTPLLRKEGIFTAKYNARYK